jgi:predicted Zn-dependent protease with MMP-like domain
MDLDAFSALVEDALESLPEEFKERLVNVQVDVAEWPSRDDLEQVGLRARDRSALLGLYHGVPMTERHVDHVLWPDYITIYQRPIEISAGPDVEAIAEQVRHTVVHEIAHYYGIDDERLEELGRY